MSVLAGVVSGLIVLIISLPSRNHVSEANEEYMHAVRRASDLQERIELAEGDQTLGLPKVILWEGQDQSIAERELQRKILDLASQNELSLNRFGVVRDAVGVSSPTISFQFEAEMTHRGLVTLLVGLERMMPKVAIEKLSIRYNASQFRSDSDKVLSVSFTVWGFFSINESIQ